MQKPLMTRERYLTAGASASASFFTSLVILTFANCAPTVNQWAI